MQPTCDNTTTLNIKLAPAPTNDSIDHNQILAAISQLGNIKPLPLLAEELRMWQEAKRNKHGEAMRYKVHLVFKEYEQIYGRD